MSFSLLLACFALVAGAGIAWLCRHPLRVAARELTSHFSGSDQLRAAAAVERLKASLGDLRAKMRWLEECAPEQQSAPFSSGLSWLAAISERLSVAEEVLDASLASERYYDAYILSGFLNGDLPYAEMPLASVRFADFVALLDWQERTRQQLLQLLDTVDEGRDASLQPAFERRRGGRSLRRSLDELRRQLES